MLRYCLLDALRRLADAMLHAAVHFDAASRLIERQLYGVYTLMLFISPCCPPPFSRLRTLIDFFLRYSAE